MPYTRNESVPGLKPNAFTRSLASSLDNKYKIIIFPGPADQFDLTVQPVNITDSGVKGDAEVLGFVLGLVFENFP